jgi:hypothetical protein
MLNNRKKVEASGVDVVDIRYMSDIDWWRSLPVLRHRTWWDWGKLWNMSLGKFVLNLKIPECKADIFCLVN